MNSTEFGGENNDNDIYIWKQLNPTDHLEFKKKKKLKTKNPMIAVIKIVFKLNNTSKLVLTKVKFTVDCL